MRLDEGERERDRGIESEGEEPARRRGGEEEKRERITGTDRLGERVNLRTVVKWSSSPRRRASNSTSESSVYQTNALRYN